MTDPVAVALWLPGLLVLAFVAGRVYGWNEVHRMYESRRRTRS